VVVVDIQPPRVDQELQVKVILVVQVLAEYVVGVVVPSMLVLQETVVLMLEVPAGTAYKILGMVQVIIGMPEVEEVIVIKVQALRVMVVKVAVAVLAEHLVMEI
jgi:hypothetical protein